MRFSLQVKPISYLKANVLEVLLQLAALALLKIMASGYQDIQQGKVVTAVGEVPNSG